MGTAWSHSQSDQYLLRTQNNVGAAVFPTLSALLYFKNKTTNQKENPRKQQKSKQMKRLHFAA